LLLISISKAILDLIVLFIDYNIIVFFDYILNYICLFHNYTLNLRFSQYNSNLMVEFISKNIYLNKK
jgi:hypothetical protein